MIGLHKFVIGPPLLPFSYQQFFTETMLPTEALLYPF